MENGNKIYQDYTKTLVKTFFKYSWFNDEQKSKLNKESQNDNLINNNNISKQNMNTLRIFPFEVMLE